MARPAAHNAAGATNLAYRSRAGTSSSWKAIEAPSTVIARTELLRVGEQPKRQHHTSLRRKTCPHTQQNHRESRSFPRCISTDRPGNQNPKIKNRTQRRPPKAQRGKAGSLTRLCISGLAAGAAAIPRHSAQRAQNPPNTPETQAVKQTLIG